MRVDKMHKRIRNGEVKKLSSEIVHKNESFNDTIHRKKKINKAFD